MSVFTYTATEELAPGTTLLELVTRDFRLTTRSRQRKPIGRRNTSLSGNVESLKFRTEKHYRLTTALLEPQTLTEDYVKEFLASVENSELFVFDRYGTIAEPDEPVSCIMVSTSFSEVEVNKVFHRYGFVIREA